MIIPGVGQGLTRLVNSKSITRQRCHRIRLVAVCVPYSLYELLRMHFSTLLSITLSAGVLGAHTAVRKAQNG